MAKETFSFEEAVAPAKVFSFEEALGEPAATNAPATEPEVVTSARPWQGAGAGRGGLNDPRRLDVERAPESFERPGFAEGFTKGLTESERPLGPGGILLRAADALTGGFAQERFNKANQSVLDDKTDPALAGEFAKPAAPKPKTPVLQPRTDTISPTGGVVDALAGVPANTARSLGSTALNFGALAAELGLTIQSPEQFRAGAAKLDKAKARTGLSVSDEPLARTGTALDALIPSAKTLADYSPEGIKQLGMMAVMGPSAIIADAGARGVNQAREEGLGIVPSVLYGAGQAASEGVPEAFSAKFAIEAAKRIPLAQALRGDARAVTTAFQQTAQSMGVELGSEQVSALGNWVVDKIAADPTATPDRLVADMKEAVKATIVQGPTMLAGAKLMQAATTGLAQRPEDQAARELARELERGNLPPGTVETLNPNLSQPAITPKTLAGLTEIGAAASVDEAIIAAARATTPQAQAVDNIGRLLGDSANVSQPGNIPPVDSGAAGAGAPEPGIRVEAGVGASGAAGPALDARGVRDQPAGGAAPLATGRGAELTPDIAETTRQIQKLERAPESKPGQETRSEPASVWFGRRGDGYQTPEDAQSALPTRTRISPELDWRVEQMPTGRYRLAGYDTETRAPTFTVRMNPTGTATVLGNPKAIAAKLAEAGITKVLPNRDGVTVATSQAQAAAQFLGGGEAVARTQPAPAAMTTVAPEVDPGDIYPPKTGDTITVDAKPAEVVGQTDIFSAPSEEQASTKTSEKTGNTTKTYGGYVDGDGVSVELSIVRRADGTLFRVFAKYGDGIRSEFDASYGPGITDEQIVKAVAEPSDWEKVAAKSTADQASEKSKGDRFPSVESITGLRVGPGGVKVQVEGEDAPRVVPKKAAKADAGTDTAPAAIKPVAPPANPPTQAQAGLPAEGAGVSRPAPAAAPEQVGPYGRDLTPIAQGGKPFKTKAQADAFRKANTNNMRTVKQGTGFVLRELTPKELAAREKAAKRIAQPRAGQAGVPISAHAFIADRGGLARDAMADAGFDRNMRVGNRWLFAGADKPGLTLAEAAELLAEAGYIREESESAAADIIKRSIRTPQYTAEGWERIAEAEQATRFEDHLAAQQEAATEEDPFGPAPAFTPAEVMVVPKSAREEYAALIDAIEAAGLDVDAILEEAARITENLTQEQYSEYVRQALTDAIANSRREADRRESAVQGREDAQRGGTEGSRQDAGRPGDAPSQADEGLTARSGIIQPQKQAQPAPTLREPLSNQEQTENDPALTEPAETDRYAAGKALTKEQRKQVLGTLVDVYKAKDAPREQKGIGPSGNERYGYVHSPELFEKSDITGAMVRYYVTLPDGRIAHPSELFPDFTQAQIDTALIEQANDERREKEGQAFAERQADSGARASPAEADAAFMQRNRGFELRDWRTGKTRSFVHYEKDGRYYSVLNDDDAMMRRVEKAGWTRTDTLTAPTQQEVLAQQQRRENADELDQRAQIDREAERQTLTAQTAPEQRRDNTGDMVGGPTAEDVARARKPGKQQEDDGTAPLFSRAPQTQTDAFKRWFGDSKVVDANGKPLVLYHGTTADFSTFDRERANPESDFGAGFYFSNTPGDVANNYAGLGPDLTNKIEREAERIASETDRDYNDPEVIAEARAKFVQNDGSTMPVYVKMEKPFVVGGKGETFLRFEQEYNEELDEYGEETGELVDVLMALQGMTGFVDIDYNKITADLSDAMSDGGIGAADLIEKLKASEGLAYAQDQNGNVAGTEIIRRALQEAGFDGVIDYTVDKKFGSQRRVGQKMKGMTAKTVHYIAFEPEQVKSAIGNRGTFDATNPDIRFSRAQPFYSALSKSIEGMTPKALPGAIWKDGIKGLINKGAVKEDEVEWSGIREWLDLQTGKVSKEDVLAYLDANGVQVQEVVLGGSKPEQEDMLTADDIRVEPEGDQGRWFIEAPTGSVTARAGTEEEAIAFGVRYFNSQIAERNRNAARDADNTKYSQYTLPGGERYREVLLTLPTPADDRMPAAKRIGDAMARLREEAAPGVDYMRTPEYQALQKQMRALNDAPDPRANAYQSSHWGGTLNVIAHIRLNDRVDSDGARVLFVEEIQSDWGQEGKKKGFDNKPPIEERDGIFYVQSAGLNNIGFRTRNVAIQALNTAVGENVVPTAPFVTSTDKWLTLALKRVITMAAQEGYDKVAFVNGEQSAERYDLSKSVESIKWRPNGRGGGRTVNIEIPSRGNAELLVNENGKVVGSRGAGNAFGSADGKQLDEVIGKEIASKIMQDADGDLSGNGLKVGGEGMRSFYDKIVPTAANKLLAKLGGGKVETVRVNQTDGFAGNERKAPAKGISSDQLGFTITPAMREKASAGLPLFRKGADQTTGLTPTQFTQALSEAFGAKVADRLQAKGVVVPLADQNSLPAHVVPHLRAGDVVFGFYDPRTDRTYAVLENLTPDMVKGLAMHEVGVHYGFEAMLGADKYKQVMKQLRLMRASGNRSVKEASQTALKSFEVSGLPGVRVGEGVYRYAHPSGDALAAQSAINKLLDKIGVVPGSSVQRGVRSDGLEQTGDGGLRAADQLADLLVSQPAIAERLSALDVKTQNMVLSLVRRSINDSKILKSIVEFVPIDVMDVLKRGQLSAEAFLDDGTMLSDLLSIDKDSAVALRINVAGRIAETITRFARFRAKNDAVVSRQSGRASENGNAALEALTRNQFIAPGLKMVVTDDTLFQEELAYLVQNNPENSVIKDVIARIKAWLFREFGIGGKYLTERDLHMLARAAVQHAARTEPGGVEVPAFMRQNAGMANRRSSKEVGRVFTDMVKRAEDDLREVLFNWNESELNADKDRIVGFPGRDRAFSRGREGGKINISKAEFLDWLASDSPFDAGIYGSSAADPAWIEQIGRLREIAGMANRKGKGAPTPDTSLKQGRPDAGMQERPTVRAVSGSLGEPAQSGGGAGSDANDTPFRVVDLFGNGSRVQHFDDRRGLFYEAQRYPSGRVGWRAGEIVDGNESWLSDKEYPTMDAAIASVRGQRAANTRKANFDAKYGDIPNTWKGEAKKVAMALIDAGHEIDRFSNSTQSTSKYIYLDNGSKVRLADHDLPGSYDQADFDFRYGDDIAEFVASIPNESPAPNPDGAPQFSRTPQTETKAFKDWFGDSVVTESGKAGGVPLVVYHGTRNNITAFDAGKVKGRFPNSEGFYFTSKPLHASVYADSVNNAAENFNPNSRFIKPVAEGGNVMPAYVSVQNPKVITVSEWGTLESAVDGDGGARVRAAREAGHDGVIVKREAGDEWDGTLVIAFRPEQIKSATGNRGTFDPKDPDIRFSRTNTAQTEEPADPVRPELSPWRDATGRLQFAPGAWLWDKLGTASGPILNKLQLKAATPELRRIMRQMKLDVAKAQEVAAAVAGEATKLTEDERAMVSDLIEKELKAGTVPPEHAVRLAAMINSSMEQQTEELVRLGMLTKDSADRWRGQYLPRYYESKLTEKAGDLWADAMRSITRRPSAMKGIKGKHLRGRGLYETIPESQLEDYKTMGWEVRDPDYQPGVTTDGTVQVWRDFTRQERDKMGEIRDAGFRFVMGYMQTQKDIALGKMFEQLAIDPEMSSRLETEKFSVRVPDGKAPGTEVKTYGKLAGRYVSPETLSQLSLIEESQSEALMMYRKAMGIWKEGKALALDTPIPTPSGWTTMGALQPGDQVFDEKGQPCEVTFATPVQMDRECFEVEFSDGCKIVADAEHLWLTKYHGVESVKTTKRILETLKYAGGQYNAHSVPVAGPLTLPDQTLPIDPYYLGVWLGNGTARNTAITSCQSDGEVIMGFLRDRGLGIGAVRKDPRGDCITYSVGFDGYRPRRELLQPTMRALNLLQNKHIPAIYLRASEQQRLDLLCGLMDTDGTISERGQLEFCTTTEALKDGIVELARSLGFKPRARKQTAAGNNQVSWLVKFHGYDDRPVFALPRKIARLRKAPETRQRSSTRQIVAITPVASVPVKCIQVSSESRLYLAGEGMIPTHNTVLNPVSHVNNTISNMSMAHFAGVSYGRADKYLAAMRDFAKKSPMILEAKDNGLFLGTLSEAELMNTLPEDLKALAQKQEGTAEKVGRTTFNLMTFYLRRPMGWAYQAEDTFFRYLIYKDARERGMEPQDAVDYAQRYIFTYDDLPKNARRIRDFGIPFFAYTYKAVPALLHTALTHPERLAAPAAVLWTINAAAYAIAAGDDEDDWDVKLRRYLTDPEYREKARAKEKLERELLPEWNKGTTSLMTPKVIRLGNDELTKLPMFIDVSRIIPGGDLFDVNPNAGGIGLPQPITPSHPLFTTAVAMLANKDLFFGKDLTDSNDTAGEKFDKRAAWMWKQLTPAITVNNYHFERGMNALAQAAGGEVKYVPDFLGGDATGIGRDGLPVQPKLAAMQTFGIKVRPYDLDAAESIQESAKQKLIRDIDTELRKLRRLENKGAVSDRTAEKERELANLKKDRLRDGKTVDGEDR